MKDASALELRLISIESQLMHLQHDFEHLNAECLRQFRLIQQQAIRLEFLESQVQGFGAKGEASESPAGNSP